MQCNVLICKINEKYTHGDFMDSVKIDTYNRYIILVSGKTYE